MRKPPLAPLLPCALAYTNCPLRAPRGRLYHCNLLCMLHHYKLLAPCALIGILKGMQRVWLLEALPNAMHGKHARLSQRDACLA